MFYALSSSWWGISSQEDKGQISDLAPPSFPGCFSSSSPSRPPFHWSPFSISQASFASMPGFCPGPCGFHDKGQFRNDTIYTCTAMWQVQVVGFLVTGSQDW